MHTYIHTYVCVYACSTSVGMYVCSMYVCMYACMYVCILTRKTHVCTHVCMHIYSHAKPKSQTQEAVATMYSAMINTDYASKKAFIDNFWDEFKKLLGKGHVIKEFSKCDFSPIVQHLEAEKEKKKTMTKEEKNVIKEVRGWLLCLERAMQ
jgi:hypothetical protein